MSLFSLCTHGLCTESRLSSKKHGSSRLIVRCPPRSHQLQVGKFSSTLSPVYATIRSVFFGLLFLLVSLSVFSFLEETQSQNSNSSASPSLMIFFGLLFSFSFTLSFSLVLLPFYHFLLDSDYAINTTGSLSSRRKWVPPIPTDLSGQLTLLT